jgi:phosphatidylglycerophosphate synthase
MDTVPVRRPVALPYRKLLGLFERRIILPDISPSYYHLFGILASILFVYTSWLWLKIILLTMVLIADWLDGATARRFNKCCRAGYLTDVLTDRVSEAFIFMSVVGTTLGQIFFLLWMINLILAFYSVRTNKHTSGALRFAYLIILIVRVFS